MQGIVVKFIINSFNGLLVVQWLILCLNDYAAGNLVAMLGVSK